MNTINKIFNGIRKIIAFPFKAIGIITIVLGTLILLGGFSIYGNIDNVKKSIADLKIELENTKNEIEEAKKEEKE